MEKGRRLQVGNGCEVRHVPSWLRCPNLAGLLFLEQAPIQYSRCRYPSIPLGTHLLPAPATCLRLPLSGAHSPVSTGGCQGVNGPIPPPPAAACLRSQCRTRAQLPALCWEDCLPEFPSQTHSPHLLGHMPSLSSCPALSLFSTRVSRGPLPTSL